MPDMLVNLLQLPPLDPIIAGAREAGVVIRNAQPWDVTPVREWVIANFGRGWADEIVPGFSRQPVSVIVALREGKLVGFAAYECTRRAFFGPTGVAESERGKGIGKWLLLAALHGLKNMGYAYAIIGGAGPTDFYARFCGAVIIPNGQPSIYADGIRNEE
jgi:predicted N-acetyltransferase YhbS